MTMLGSRIVAPRPGVLASWLRWVGIEGCSCEYAWRSLGYLYGVSMGKGWVRMTTEPDCSVHAKRVMGGRGRAA